MKRATWTVLIMLTLIGCSANRSSQSSVQPPASSVASSSPVSLITPTAVPTDSPSPPAAPVSTESLSGCGPSALPAIDPAYERGWGSHVDLPILGTGEVVDSVDDIPSLRFTPRLPPMPPLGLAYQVILIDQPTLPIPGFRIFYSSEPINDKTTFDTLLVGHGVFLHENGSSGVLEESNIRTLLGDRANPVRVGDYDGFLVWSDPVDETGHRYFSLLWSDGTLDLEIRAGVSDPDALVDFGRSIVCV